MIKLFFPANTRREVQVHRRIEAPVERRTAPVASGLIALMDHSQAEADDYNGRLLLLEDLETYMDQEMDECVALDVLDVPVLLKKQTLPVNHTLLVRVCTALRPRPHIPMAVSCLFLSLSLVTVTAELQGLFDTDYHRYAALVIKQAESSHRKLALQAHPDKQNSSLTVMLRERCDAAMTLLNNSLDAVKHAFSRHIVPAADGVQAYFSLEDAVPDIVLRWDLAGAVETEIVVGDGEEDGVEVVRAPLDVGIETFSYKDYPHMFKQDQIVFTVAHVGVFGAQADFKSAETRVVLPTTEDVFDFVDGIESAQQAKVLKEELRKLRFELHKRHQRPIGASGDDDTGYKRRRTSHYTPTPPWRTGGKSSTSNRGNSGNSWYGWSGGWSKRDSMSW